jgi:hypothetical protein
MQSMAATTRWGLETVTSATGIFGPLIGPRPEPKPQPPVATQGTPPSSCVKLYQAPKGESPWPRDIADYYRKIDELDLSVRSHNCLKSANIATVGDLVQWSGSNLLRIPNLGRRSLRDIIETLASMGLSLSPQSNHATPLPLDKVEKDNLKRYEEAVARYRRRLLRH